MPTIVIETLIKAPAEVCFELIRDARLHAKDSAVAISGRFGLGQTVTFEGRHFGMKQRLTVKVVEFARPRLLIDEMTVGRFKNFRHIHELSDGPEGTVLRDTLVWTSRLGVLGRLIDKLAIEPHLTQLVRSRNNSLKKIAEAI